MTIIIPAFGGGPNIERTIASVAGICDEVVIVSTALYDEDKEHFKRIAAKVVELPWNHVFHHGYGSVYNQGSTVAKNDWLLLLGVAETWAETRIKPRILLTANSNAVFRCDHVNDPCRWKRIWNRTGGTQWSGIIHEEIVGGAEGGLMFRMQDTDKVPPTDPLKGEVFRWVKALSYNHLYDVLLNHPERLGGASPNWLKFVAGAKESIVAFVDEHRKMLNACLAGDQKQFIELVRLKTEPAHGVSFVPQGV